MIKEYVRKGGEKRYIKKVNKKGKLVKSKSLNKGGNKIGMFIAIPKEDTVRIGWSLCHKTDNFDVLEGLHKATERAEKDNMDEIIASSLTKKMERFINRVELYYKDKKIKVPFSMGIVVNNGIGEDVGC